MCHVGIASLKWKMFFALVNYLNCHGIMVL